MTNILYDQYKVYRQSNNATNALLNARRAIAAGKRIYSTKRYPEYNPATNGVRWVENVSAGLRLVGYADEIVKSIRHTGWFTDEFQDDKLRGIVYRLPARNGKEQFVAGYDDHYNPGCALLDFASIYDDQSEAAKAADSFCEIKAEEAREYNEAYNAGRDYSDLGDEIKTHRKDAIELIKAIRKERRPNIPSVICETLRAHVSSHLRDIAKLKEKRNSLLDDFSATWRKELHTAFNDGAGEQIITA